MKAPIVTPLVPRLLVGAFALVMGGQMTARTFTNLHYFTGGDGAVPYAGLILAGDTLYGTTAYGGSGRDGTVFAVKTDGTGFKTLYSFSETNFRVGTNIDGSNPFAGLVLSGKTLYGTAVGGGSSLGGTVFAVNTDGTGFRTLHSFTERDNSGNNSDGVNPHAALVLSGNTLYGTAGGGGSSGNGTVFAVNTNGTGFTTLYDFTGGSDGANPTAGWTLLSNTLYGTTAYGGRSGLGTVFAVNTDGTGFTNLHSFAAGSGSFPNVTNNDGAYPDVGLILGGNILYGTAYTGGSSGRGTVYAINTDGTGFRTVNSFTGVSDGRGPHGLFLSGDTLYGVAAAGGDWNYGTLFRVNLDGTSFTVLHSFTATSYDTNSDGIAPFGTLTLSGNTLFGTASYGGSGVGTIFGLFLPPQLTIIPSLSNVILTWRTNATGLALQSATDLASPVWTTNCPAPVVINGQNIVTNPISGAQQFYRLSQ